MESIVPSVVVSTSMSLPTYEEWARLNTNENKRSRDDDQLDVVVDAKRHELQRVPTEVNLLPECISIGCHQPVVPESDVGYGPMLCVDCYARNNQSQQTLARIADMTPSTPPNSPALDSIPDRLKIKLRAQEGKLSSLSQQMQYLNRRVENAMDQNKTIENIQVHQIKINTSLSDTIDNAVTKETLRGIQQLWDDTVSRLSARITELEVLDRPIKLGRALNRDDGSSDITAEARAMKMTGVPVLTLEQEEKSAAA